ncbi:response regulator [Rhizobium sp. L43]|uniref:response regulator n=1 Tax=Rhizobium sp. L43 TaxID=2035452 RepID=UPI000BE79E17|nr:response regulator [Rhizobium sp. L43]PDS77629.1 response regulator [Rhizobium sp. L43]
MTSFGPPATSANGSDTGAADRAGRAAGGGRPTRILIVEDEYLIALDVENRLLDAGFEVIGIAVTASEAISMAVSGSPDLAIMDIRLADRTDGVQAAIELFAMLGVRSIFASAHADDRTRERAAAASPIGWLQKPYSAEALINLIRQHLE